MSQGASDRGTGEEPSLPSNTSPPNPYMSLETSVFLEKIDGLTNFNSNAQSQSQGIVYKLIDSRDSNIFNGWPDDTTGRGGHVRGARSFSSSWLHFIRTSSHTPLAEGLDEVAFDIIGKRGKQSKVADCGDAEGNKDDAKLDAAKLDIDDNVELIIYDSNGIDSIIVADFFRQHLGLRNTIYVFRLAESNVDILPLESFPNYHMLVPPSWVYKKLYCDESSQGGSQAWKVFQTAWGEEDADPDYAIGHIKSAVYINTDEVEEPPLWSLKSDIEIANFARSNGIRTSDSIILYSNNAISSFRVAILLMSLGVHDVRVLNGGLDAWKAAKLPLETTKNPKVSDNCSDILTPRVNLMVGLEEARLAALGSGDTQLVDIRSLYEHLGRSTGYSYSEAKGRPKGCLFGNSSEYPNPLEVKNYRNIDGTMKSGDDIFRMWRRLNIDYDNKKLIFFCGSGWRASEVLFYALVIGCPMPCRLYSSGWFEWSAKSATDSNLYKIEVGFPQTGWDNFYYRISPERGMISSDIASATFPESEISSGRSCSSGEGSGGRADSLWSAPQQCSRGPRTTSLTTMSTALNSISVDLSVKRSTLYPPESFNMVVEGVYRGALPSQINFEFLSTLGLKTFILLSATMPASIPSFFESPFGDRVKLVHITTITSDLISDTEVCAALKTVTDLSNLPCMISCELGMPFTGVVIGCLRRLQNWSMTSILEEFHRYTDHHRSQHHELLEQLIECFDGDLTGIDRTHSTCPSFLR